MDISIREELLKARSDLESLAIPSLKSSLLESLDSYVQIVDQFLPEEEESDTPKHLKFKNLDDLNPFITRSLKIEKILLKFSLPIFKSKRKILNGMAYHNILIFISPTGTGKSSQLPVYFSTSPVFYDSAVLIVEPKDLAASSLASKVKKDFEGILGVALCANQNTYEDLSNFSVIYFSENAFLNILLAELSKDSPLERTKIVILDDLHESTANMEVILCLLLELIKSKRPDLRIILTSATLNEQEIEAYLSAQLNYSSPQKSNQKEPELSIKHLKIKISEYLHDVKSYYLSESTNYFKDTFRTIERVLLIEEAKKILVFLPSQVEIFKMKSRLLKFNKDLDIITLYSEMNRKKEAKAFRKITQNEKTVVLATNYAESSITLSDVTHVIDTGREKIIVAKGINYFENILRFISISSSIQRKGRAGRESSGTCYCMYTLEEYSEFQQNKNPSILTDCLELIFLKLTKHKIDINKLQLLHPLSSDIIVKTFKKLHINNGITYNETQLHLNNLTDIGDLADFLEIDLQLAGMIFRCKYYFDVIIMAAALQVYNSVIDYTKGRSLSFLFYSQGFDDFMMSLIVMRQFCSVRCEKCFKDFQEFYPETSKDFLDFLETDCKDCRAKKKQWALFHNFDYEVVKIVLTACVSLINKLNSRGIQIINDLDPSHYLAESSFMQQETLDLGNSLIVSYRSLSEDLRVLVLKVFCYNLFENISNKSLLAFRNIFTGLLAVPSSSFSDPNVYSSDFVLCLVVEKYQSKIYLKYLAGYSFADLEYYVPYVLQRTNYCPLKDRFSVIEESSLGEKFHSLLKLNSYELLTEFETKLENEFDKFILRYDKNKSTLSILIDKKFVQNAHEMMVEFVSMLYSIIQNDYKIHYSIGYNNLAVITLGNEIVELISAKNEIRYKISGLDTSIPKYVHIKNIKNTFRFKYITLEKYGNEYDAFLYFSNQKEAEDAKVLLRSFPLKGIPGKNNRIFEMEPLIEGALRGSSAKVIAPCFIDMEIAQKVFGHFRPSNILLKKCTHSESVAILSFQSREGAEYFINNYRHVFRSLLSVSTAIVKIIAEGISTPKELLKVKDLENYIQLLSNTYKCEIKLNPKKGKIISQYEDLPIQAQEKLCELINSDTVEAPLMIWNEIANRTHLLDETELTWEAFQTEKNVSCTYIKKSKVIQIFGIPEDRSEFLAYIKEYISFLMNKLVSFDFEWDRVKEQATMIQQFSKLEFKFGEQSSKKFSVLGLEEDVKEFINFFYQNNPPNFPVSICQICQNDESRNKHKLGLCGHTIHKTCFITNIRSKLSMFGVPIKCYFCSLKVLHEDLLMICPYDLIQEIQLSALEKFLNGAGKEKFAWCEMVNCGYVYEKHQIDHKTLIRFCPKCNLNICTKCCSPAVRFHNIECEKKLILKNNKEMSKWIRSNAVSCPKCGFSVEKTGGCNHMTCPMCESHYCFVCSREIKNKVIMEHFLTPNTLCYQKYINNPG